MIGGAMFELAALAVGRDVGRIAVTLIGFALGSGEGLRDLLLPIGRGQIVASMTSMLLSVGLWGWGARGHLICATNRFVPLTALSCLPPGFSTQQTSILRRNFVQAARGQSWQ